MTTAMTLDYVWSRLSQVDALSFLARSTVETGWDGKGVGTVVAECDGDTSIVFAETGTWTHKTGRENRFRNVFRWTRLDGKIRLEHLRFGKDHPVFLFDLKQTDEHVWQSESAHVCSDDCYSAVMKVFLGQIFLRWEVNGPRKREKIEYHYLQATNLW
jgi:hypothetical protein